jgi:DNA-binding IclR family transcriptional regulator
MPTTSKPLQNSERRGIQSVEIAFRLLSALQHEAQAVPLKHIAAAAGMTPSAANNYLVSLVRTGLAMADDKPGHYKLGPAALSLGISAIRQMDGLELVRRELAALHELTQHGAAISTWTQDGPLSLFKLDGRFQGAFELRTGLIPLLNTAAGKVFVAALPLATTRPLIRREIDNGHTALSTVEELHAEAKRELERKKYMTVQRGDMSGYVSIAAPVRDWSGEVRFAISLIGARTLLQTERTAIHVKALLQSAERATAQLGGPSAPD